MIHYLHFELQKAGLAVQTAKHEFLKLEFV